MHARTYTKYKNHKHKNILRWNLFIKWQMIGHLYWSLKMWNANNRMKRIWAMFVWVQYLLIICILQNLPLNCIVGLNWFNFFSSISFGCGSVDCFYIIVLGLDSYTDHYNERDVYYSICFDRMSAIAHILSNSTHATENDTADTTVWAHFYMKAPNSIDNAH